MPRREMAQRRRSPSLRPRRTILVVVGADRTETDYLKGLRSHVNAPSVTMRVVAKPGSPDQLVQHARDSFDRELFDEVWCVTDVDHYEREGGTAVERAQRLDPTGLDHVRNPSTGVWRLVNVILEQK